MLFILSVHISCILFTTSDLRACTGTDATATMRDIYEIMHREGWGAAHSS